MTVIVTLHKTADPEGFGESLDAAGIAFTRPMRRILICDWPDMADFPLADDPAILALENDDPEGFGIAEDVTLAALPTLGPWGLLRHTSRDRPWGAALRPPYAGSFSCVRDGTGVDIYVVDTGLRATHDEFDDRATVIDGWTALHTHGTTVASMAAGATTGLARGALIFAAAGLRNANNTGSTSDVLDAIGDCLAHYEARAATNRPALLNLSLSGGSASYAAALDEAMDAGIVVVAAAGNDRTWLSTVDVYPAEVPGVIIAGGINADDRPYDRNGYGTNFGTEVDILAAAQSVRGADYTADDAYRTGNGTSYASPMVVGALACLLEGAERLTTREQVQEVGMFLYNTATFGRYRPMPRFEPMTPAIAYVDPGAGPHEAIPTLAYG